MAERDPLANGLKIVRWMAERPENLFGVREIGRELEMQPSTVSRILSKLAAERLVRRDERTGEYSLGLELVRLGLAASQKLDIRSVARPHLEKVVTACNETTLLGLYDSTRREMLRVDRVNSTEPVTYTVRLDTWTEIYRGASGLGILAFLPPADAESVLDEADREADENSPWLRKHELRAELERIRRRGYALTRGRRLHGAMAVSAPIFGQSSEIVVGDVVTTIPEYRWPTHDEAKISRLVMEAADGITRELRGNGQKS